MTVAASAAIPIQSAARRSRVPPFVVYGPAKAMFSITESYATDSRTDWKKRLVFKREMRTTYKRLFDE